MKFSYQVIEKHGRKEFVVIPYEEYLKILEMIEDYEDLKDLRKAKEETINEPSIPYDKLEEMINKNKG